MSPTIYMCSLKRVYDLEIGVVRHICTHNTHSYFVEPYGEPTSSLSLLVHSKSTA